MSADDSTNPEVRGGTPMVHKKPSADTARADTSTDDALREAVKDLNRSCGPRTVEALIGLLRSFNMAVPRRIAGRPVLAFIRYGQAKLPVAVRFRFMPVTRTETMLAAIAADYSPGSPTAALAEALSAVLHVCDRQYATGHADAPVRVVTEAIATPLNALLRPWADEPDTEPHTEPNEKPDTAAADGRLRKENS